ncbi:hypothetical protein NVP2275O_106 [Vibrio phage 2.275.O._10N.286.54.E11]|nr:hypothetical protein NVP2275O_106 [Vibrio phage 2.275.O._10N.286.54.E11]
MTIKKIADLTADVRSALELDLTNGMDKAAAAEKHDVLPRVVGMVQMKMKASSAETASEDAAAPETTTAGGDKLAKLAALKEEVGEVDSEEKPAKERKKREKKVVDKTIREVIIAKSATSKMAFLTAKANYGGTSEAFLVGKLKKKATERKASDLAQQFGTLSMADDLTITRTVYPIDAYEAALVTTYQKLVSEGYEMVGRAPKGAVEKAPRKPRAKKVEEPESAEEIQAKIDALLALKAEKEVVLVDEESTTQPSNYAPVVAPSNTDSDVSEPVEENTDSE